VRFRLAPAKATIGDRVALKGYVDLLYVVLRGTPDLVERTVAEAMEIGKARRRLHSSAAPTASGRALHPRTCTPYFQACLKHGAYR